MRIFINLPVTSKTESSAITLELADSSGSPMRGHIVFVSKKGTNLAKCIFMSSCPRSSGFCNTYKSVESMARGYEGVHPASGPS